MSFRKENESMSAIIDIAVSEKCWNLRDSFGQICVGCGCCSDDNKTRYESRLACIERWIKHEEVFDLWDDDPAMRELQERNRAENLRHYRIQRKYYRYMLKKVVVAKNATTG